MKRNIKGAAQYQFSKMTGTDSTAVRKAINKNIPFEADSFKKGIANPSTYGYHHNRFVYSDAKRNASGIGSGGTVRGGEAALNSYNRYRTDKETAATTLKNLTSEFGSTAIAGIREEMVVGPKLNNRVNPQQEFLKPNPTVKGIKHGAPQEIKDVSELPGYQPIISSSVNIPGRKTAVAKAAAIATGVHTGLTFSGAYNKLDEKWKETKLYKKLEVVDEKAKVFDKKATEWIKNKFSGAPQGAYENPNIIQDADGAVAGVNALSGVNEAIQIQSLKKPEKKDGTDTGEGDTEGAAQIARGLRHLNPQTLHLAAAAHYGKDTSPHFGMDLPKMEAGDDSYERSGREEVYNMTPNVSEEEAKKVREKNERTYLKSGSPRMVNKLRKH